MKKRRGRPNNDINEKASGSVREIASKIRTRRQSLNLTLADVAARSFGLVDIQQLSYIERGHEPKMQALIGICIALDTPVYDFLPDDLRELVLDPSRRVAREVPDADGR